MKDVIINGIYKHFKGNKYKVLLIAKDAQSIEDIIIYQQIDDMTKIWTRTKSNFLENINRHGKTLQRFKHIE